MTRLLDEKNKFMRPLPILNNPDSFKNLKILTTYFWLVYYF